AALPVWLSVRILLTNPARNAGVKGHLCLDDVIQPGTGPREGLVRIIKRELLTTRCRLHYPIAPKEPIRLHSLTPGIDIPMPVLLEDLIRVNRPSSRLSARTTVVDLDLAPEIQRLPDHC